MLTKFKGQKLGFIFDFTGTLVEMEWNTKEAFDEIFSGLRTLGIATDTLENCRYTVLLDRAKELAVKKDIEEQVIKKLIFSVFEKYDLDALSRWQLKEGAQELLDWVKKEGHFLAMATNIGAKAITGALAKFGLTGYFEVVINRDSGFPMKPRPEGLKHIVELSALPRDNVFLIGDSLDDIKTAREAGLKVMIITGGEDQQETIMQYEPDVMVHNFHELRDILFEGI
ncbi:MAG: HAD family hydrolase [Desulfotomaculaceae bacterium]